MKMETLSMFFSDSALSEKIIQQVENVKHQPGDVAARELLFKLYCIDAGWKKALRQLDILMGLSPAWRTQGELYKHLVMGELLREHVLMGKRQPATFSGEIPDWMLTLQQANRHYYQGDIQVGSQLREQALIQSPVRSGYSEHSGAFSWLADGDDRLGPICEVMCAGGYRWLPFADITRLTLSSPKQLTDLLWLPCELECQQGNWKGYLPARYPPLPECEDACKLGFKTQWQDIAENYFIGVGQKMLITGDGSYPLNEMGNITLHDNLGE